MLICPLNYKGAPAGYTLLLQGLSFTSWTGFYGFERGSERGRDAVAYSLGGTGGRNPLEFIFPYRADGVIEMLIQGSYWSYTLHLDKFLHMRRGAKACGFKGKKEQQIKHKSFREKVRQRDWNVGTASKGALRNHQHNPCKITRQRWCVHVYVCVHVGVWVIVHVFNYRWQNPRQCQPFSHVHLSFLRGNGKIQFSCKVEIVNFWEKDGAGRGGHRRTDNEVEPLEWVRSDSPDTFLGTARYHRATLGVLSPQSCYTGELGCNR